VAKSAAAASRPDASKLAMQQGLDVLGGYMSPVHKGYGKKGLLENDARIELCEKAVETSDWIMVDCWEASQPQHSTTLPVLQSIRHRLADKLGMSLVRLFYHACVCKDTGYRHHLVDLDSDALDDMCLLLHKLNTFHNIFLFKY
jgi:hypothetical protein